MSTRETLINYIIEDMEHMDMHRISKLYKYVRTVLVAGIAFGDEPIFQEVHGAHTIEGGLRETKRLTDKLNKVAKESE